MVPFMRTFGYAIRKSIGTAAAVGFLISLSWSNHQDYRWEDN
ncbi:hypothetical protein ABXT72_04595 [Candidatus Pelagibacter sp. Uisw_094]